MNLLAVSINGILDLKNLLILSRTLLSQHSINLDVVVYRPNLTDCVDQYDGLIVGSDWNANGAIVEAFKARGKRTILVQSEGLFVNPDQWYIGKAPRTDLACLWGSVHESIFSQRGYIGETVVTGPPRLDIYNEFRPDVSRSECYKSLGLPDIERPFVLFLCQHFPEAEWGAEIAENQMEFTRLAASSSSIYTSIIKIHPQEPPTYFLKRSNLLSSFSEGNFVISGVGSSSEPVDIDSLIFHSAGAISFSSTGLFEALLLNRSAGVFRGSIRSPLEDGSICNLPVVNNVKDVELLIKEQAQTQNLSGFLGKFVPSVIDGKNTYRCAAAIASFMGRSNVNEIVSAQSSPKTEKPINEAEVNFDDYSSYRLLAIQAHSKLALTLNSMSTIERLKAIKGALGNPSQSDIKQASYYQELHDSDYGYRNNNWLMSEVSLLRKLNPSSILEIGCGNGKFISTIADFVPNVIGVDFAKSPMLDMAPQNVSFIQCDVVDDPLPSADLICSADVLEHFPFEVIRDVLRKILHAGPRQYHIIACYDDGHSHLTILPPGEWLALFREFDKSVNIIDIRPRRNSSDQVVCVLSNCVSTIQSVD